MKAILLVLSFILLLPLILPYHKTSLELGGRQWGEIVIMLPRINSYFYPPGASLLWSWLTPLGRMLPASGEHQIFAGIFPLAAFMIMPVFYSRYRTDPLQKKAILAWLTLSFIILSTLYIGYSLYKVVLFIPGMSGIRAVARIMLMNLFLLSIIIGAIITKLSNIKALSSNNFRKTVIASMALVLISLDQSAIATNTESYSKIESQNRLKIIENIVQRTNRTARAFAYMPQKSSGPPYLIHLDAMMAAQNLNMATVNGYSGKFPRGYFGSFFEHYDQYDGYLAWMMISTNNYHGPENRRSLFNNVFIISN